MSRRSKTVLSVLVLLGIAASATSAFLITRAATEPPKTQDPAPSTQNRRTQRGLVLQPEAFRVSRRLGKRFEATGSGATTSVGKLTTTGSQQPVTIVRRRTEVGETAEFAIGTRTLTWSDGEGIKAVVGIPTPAERLLVERLLLDSPDQFVLAQLSGASYFTMARNVRADDAVDDQPGPSWTQVRVSYPENDQTPRSTSSWRIYYINSATGLIDRIVSEFNGRTAEARIVRWIEEGGEKFPAHITWSVDDETILDYQLSTASQN